MGGRITMKKTDYRVERDSIGVKDIPEDVYYGVPPSEFVGAFMKLTYHGITKVLVELNTVMV